MTTPDIATARARAFEIIARKSFARRQVKLASGKESDHYFNMKPTMLDPEGANLLSALVLDRLKGVKADAIGGLEMGAIPLIGPIAAMSWQHFRLGHGHPIPGFFVRKEQKGYGAQKQIEGLEDVRGLSVVIVDDVTTTGGSALKSGIM
jgi:orotate phosphoribosyltransferase